MKLKKMIQTKVFFGFDVSSLDYLNKELKKLSDEGKKIIYTKYISPSKDKPYRNQLFVIYECDNI